MDSSGVEKYCGAISLKRLQLSSPKMTMMTKKQRRMAYDSRMAILKAFTICVKLGKKCSTRKNRRTLNILKMSSIDKSIMPVGRNASTSDGSDTMTKMPSSRFQPECQYSFAPSLMCLTIISIRKIRVQAMSKPVSKGVFTPLICK